MLAENNTERTEQWKIEEYQKNINIINYMLKKYNNIYVKNRSLDIKIEDRLYKVIRLNDAQFYLLYKNGIAISDDYAHLMMLSRDDSIIYSSFSKMYITLKSLFGESGGFYDDWKGSFSFPFLICFERDEEKIGYLMNVYNIRSSIDFRITKLINADNKEFERDIVHSPFEEFSRRDINYIINYFVGFLTGYFETVKDEPDEFFKIVRSNLIIFGYKDGEYFDDQYDNQDEFDEEIEKLSQNIPEC